MASWLSTGAGAGAGLEKLLARQLAEDKFAEEMRQNQAREEIQRKQLEENSGWRKLQIESMNDARKAGQDQREQDRIARTVAMRPIGSQVTEAEMQREMAAGVPSSIYQRGGGAGDAETGGTSNMVPFQTWGGSQSQLHSQERIANLEGQRDVANDAAYQARLLREHAENRLTAQGVPPVPVHDPTAPGGVRLVPRGQVTPYGPSVGAVPSMTPPGGQPAQPAPPPSRTPSGPQIDETGGTLNQGPRMSIGTEVGRPGTPQGVPATSGGGGYAAPLPAASREKLTAYETTLQMIDDLEREHPYNTWAPALGWFDANVGATIRSRVPGAAAMLPDSLTGGGAQGERLRAQLGRLRAQASFQEGGKQFTGTEAKLLDSFLSSVESQPEVAHERLEEFKRAAQTSLAQLQGGSPTPTPATRPGARRRFNPATGRLE